jgi:hypothetical protein
MTSKNDEENPPIDSGNHAMLDVQTLSAIETINESSTAQFNQMKLNISQLKR